MTVEPNTLTPDEAQRLTERIRVALDRVSTAWADLGERITEAYQRRADLALGYGSWQEYAEAELKPTEGLAAEVRRQLVGMLSQAGMSTRAIAPTVGASHTQVRRDQQVERDVPRDEPADIEHIDYGTGEVLDEESAGGTWEDYWPSAPQPEASKPEPDTVTGLDGKKYPKPAPEPKPAKPRRRPIVDVASDAGWELRKATERIQRILADDRYARNSDEVARLLRGHLIYTVEACQGFVDQLPTK